MANTQTFSIKLTANGKEVKELMDALKKQADDYEKELVGINEQLKERDKLTKEEIKTLEKQADSLIAKIKGLNTAVEENITNLRKADDVLKNLAGSSGAELGKALRGIGQQFKSVSDQTLKAGETMEQKLTEIKEKMMEVRHEMAKREGVDAMKRAQASLAELANTPLDKLKMGLDSIEKKLSTMSNAERHAADGLTLMQGRAQYKAQIALTELGGAGFSSDIQKMNEEQLRAEQQRLRSLYGATNGAKGYENISQDALNRLHEVNDALTEMRKNADAIDLSKVNFDDLNTTSLEKLDAMLKQIEKDEKTLTANDKAASEQMAANKRKVQDAIQRVKRQTQDYANAEKVAANTGKYNVQQLQAAYDTLRQKLMGLASGQKKEISEVQQQMKRVKAAIDDTTGSINEQSSVWKSAVKNITAYVGVFGAFNFVKNKITEVIRGGEELSDQMAQVRMVSGLAMEDIEDLTRTLAKMDTRTTLSELERIAYAGAKLGFGEYGTKGLEEFVRAANQVNVALREDLGEEALTALSKITENMGLIKKMGVEDAMLATSSAMFKLAATSTAAAGPIVEVTKRLVPVAQASGMATHEILALASASDSLQLMPEVVGTALSKLLMAMQNNHNLIEQTLGIDEGTIARMIKAGDVMDAMLLIFDKMSGKNMTELSGIWKLLGSDGQRLITVVQAMANHTDTLRKHLETSTQAFKEATAVTEEYNIQQETAAALMQRASNLWRNAMVNADTSLSVKEMAKSWYDFSKSVLDSEFSLGAIKVTIDALLLSIRLLINLLPMIAFGLMAKGAAMLAVKLTTAKMSVDGFTLSWKKMDAATKSNWISLAIGLFAQAAFSVYQWAKSNEEAEASQRKLNQALDSAAEKAEQEIAAMSRLKAQVEDTSLSQEERMKMFSKFKTDYDIYLNYLGIELKSVDELAKHYDALTRVMRQRFAYQEREDYKRDVMGGEEGLRMRRRTAGSDLTRIANDINQKVDLSVIDSYVASGVTPGEISQKILGKRPNVQMSIPTDKLRDAIVHYAQARLDETLKEKQIDAAFAQEIGDFDYDKWLRTQVKGDFKLKPDKAAEKALTKAQQAEKKRLKDEMDEAQKDSTAVINAIEEFYRLQESAVEQLVADGKMTREEADRALNYVKNRKDLMLMNARRAIAGKDSDFEELRKTMGQDMLRPDDVNSKRAMNTVQTIDVAEAARRLQKFDGSKAVYDLNAGSFTQAMLKNAAQNELNIQRRQAAVQVEIDKLLLQYRHVEQAQRDFGDKLVKMGLITDGYQKVVQQLADGTEIVANTNEVQSFANKVVGLGSSLYAVNPESTDQLKQLMQTTMTTNGTDKESFAAIFPNYDKWMKQPEQYKEQMQAMYELMIQYEGIYYDKLKQRDDLQNKRLGSWWDHSDQKKENDRKLRNIQLYDFQYNTMHEGETMGFMMGLTNDLTHDPEVMREQAILEAKIAIWKKAKEEREANLISEEVYQQKLRDMQDQTMAYSQKVMENLNKRISRIQAFVKPVETAANTIGKKLGDMIFNMQSEESTWEQIWKNMALAMAESLLTMIGQYAQYQIQKAAINKSEVLDEAAKAQAITMLGISSGAAKTIGTLGWWGIALIPVITSLLMGLLTSALSTASKTSNSSSSTAATTKTKLVSGMLTYDKGNVQRFIGQDGKVYTATAEPAPKDGLVTHPIATTVQGQPALVAENGPEIVIGRETTKAIMMNEPELIRYLANYQQHGGRRLFDSGNVDTVQGEGLMVQGASDAAAERQALINRLDRSDALMEQVLYFLQNPIAPEIAMYDTGGKKGLRSKMKEVDRFMARYGG